MSIFASLFTSIRGKYIRDYLFKQVFMKEKSLIKKNILQYLDSKGISKYKFYQDTGITRGVLSQNNGMSEENTARIIAYYNEVNPEWLITGHGPMIRQSSEYSINQEDNTLVAEDPSSYTNRDQQRVMFKIGALSNSVIKHNIKLYISYSGITKSKFCQETGVPLEILDQEGGVDEENIAKILSRYEDINPEWLIMGKGKMIRETLRSEITKHPPNPDSLESINTNLRSRIERLLNIIESQQDVIKNYCDIIQKQQSMLSEKCKNVVTK
jgi:hypothetical protein